MLLTRLIYFSENQIVPQAGSFLPALSDILSKSNRNNKPLGVTGALIFDEQWFLQALEGDRPRVWATFERIRQDERHDGLVVAEFVETRERVFGNWWMGLATRYAKTEDIFQSLLAGGKFDPRSMTAGKMLELMIGLSRVGLSRELTGKRDATMSMPPLASSVSRVLTHGAAASKLPLDQEGAA